MVASLSFAVSGTPRTADEDIPYLDIEVTALVNGESLLRPENGFAFDTARLLALQDSGGEFYPYTCGCGTAGCAGIWHEVTVTVADGLLVWHLPETPFDKWLNPQLSNVVEDRRLSFNLEQYLAALNGLVAQMKALGEAARLPVNFAVGSHVPEERLTRPIEEVLAEDREWLLDWMAEQQQREQVYGPLRNAVVYVECSHGLELGVNVEWLTDHLAQQAGHDDDSDEYVGALTAIAASFRENGERAVEAVRTLSCADLWELSWVSKDGTAALSEINANAELLAPLRKAATYRLELA